MRHRYSRRDKTDKQWVPSIFRQHTSEGSFILAIIENRFRNGPFILLLLYSFDQDHETISSATFETASPLSSSRIGRDPTSRCVQVLHQLRYITAHPEQSIKRCHASTSYLREALSPRAIFYEDGILLHQQHRIGVATDDAPSPKRSSTGIHVKKRLG